MCRLAMRASLLQQNNPKQNSVPASTTTTDAPAMVGAGTTDAPTVVAAAAAASPATMEASEPVAMESSKEVGGVVPVPAPASAPATSLTSAGGEGS